MPRGEHLKKVKNKQIIDRFDEMDHIERNAYTPEELAEGLDIQPRGLKYRLFKLEGEKIEREPIPGLGDLWKKKDESVWADGGIGQLLASDIQRVKNDFINKINSQNTVGRTSLFVLIVIGLYVLSFVQSSTLFLLLAVLLTFPLLVAVFYHIRYHPRLREIYLYVFDRVSG